MKKETEVERLNRILTSSWPRQESDDASFEAGFNAVVQERNRLLRAKKEELVNEVLKMQREIRRLTALIPVTERSADAGMSKKEEVTTRVQLLVDWLRRKKIDPLNLPSHKNGAKTIRAKLKKAMKNEPLFSGDTAFDYAWRKAKSGKNPVIRVAGGDQ